MNWTWWDRHVITETGEAEMGKCEFEDCMKYDDRGHSFAAMVLTPVIIALGK